MHIIMSGPPESANRTIPSTKRLLSFPEYQDYSTKDDAWIEHRFSALKLAKKSAGGAKTQFPLQLFRMLHDVEARGMSWIIGWLSHGRAFKVHNRELFETRILPHYFTKQSEISSFHRQLCLYGFLRLVGKHADQHSYYHEFFLRGRIDLCRLMNRTCVQPATRRRVYDPNSEPDLYSFSPMPMTHTGSVRGATVPPGQTFSPCSLNEQPDISLFHITGRKVAMRDQRPASFDEERIARSAHHQRDAIMLNGRPVERRSCMVRQESCVVPVVASSHVFSNQSLESAMAKHWSTPFSGKVDDSFVKDAASFGRAPFHPDCAVVSNTVAINHLTGTTGELPGANGNGKLNGVNNNIVDRLPRPAKVPKNRVAILGMAEYLDSFPEVPLVDDQSVLSESDMSLIPHHGW